jgi:hypothetical protein
MTPADLAQIAGAFAAGTVQAHKDLEKLAEDKTKKRNKEIKARREALDKIFKLAGITDDTDRKARIDTVIADEFPTVAPVAPAGTPLPPPAPVAPAAPATTTTTTTTVTTAPPSKAILPTLKRIFIGGPKPTPPTTTP